MTRFVIVYVCLIAAAIGIFWGIGELYTPGESGVAAIRFVVEDGQSVSSIARGLAQDGLIDSRMTFFAYSIFSGRFSHFKPGVYSLSASSGIPSLVKLLTSGPQEEVITLYPGMTLREMDKRFTALGLLHEGELASAVVDDYIDTHPFLAGASSLEGYLMPDTYRVYPHYDVAAVVETMLDNFWERNGDVLEGREDIHRIVTIASLIEKEVLYEEDKPLVSSVIYNRLNIDMPLQIDASVFYGTCDGVFLGCELTRSAFSQDTPYNTYHYKELPPTPISNPSPSSIRAAIHPEQSPYFFYLADRSTKKTLFSETFDEHNEKRAIYLGL